MKFLLHSNGCRETRIVGFPLKCSFEKFLISSLYERFRHVNPMVLAVLVSDMSFELYVVNAHLALNWIETRRFYFFTYLRRVRCIYYIFICLANDFIGYLKQYVSVVDVNKIFIWPILERSWRFIYNLCKCLLFSDYGSVCIYPIY